MANTPQSELDDHSSFTILNPEIKRSVVIPAIGRSCAAKRHPQDPKYQNPKVAFHPYPYFNFFSVNFSRTAVLVDGYAISSLNATITYPTKTMFAVMIAQMADIVVEPSMSAQH